MHAPRLRGRQRLLRAPGDGAALLLGDERHDADGEVVGLWHVGGEEADAAVPQGQEEGGVAGEAVQLGDHQRRAGDLGQVQRLRQFRPIGLAAALDLREAAEQGRGPRLDQLLDGVTLGFEAQAAAALAGGGDALVGDDAQG